MRDLRLLLVRQAGLRGEGLRYVVAGGFVALVYLCSTLFLADVVKLPFRLALVSGFSLQLAVHFALQRMFVWVHDSKFALTFRRQARRYLAVAAVQLGLTTLSTSVLPAAVGVSTEVVYVATLALLTILNFLLMRNVVFHAERRSRRWRGGATATEPVAAEETTGILRRVVPESARPGRDVAAEAAAPK